MRSWSWVAVAGLLVAALIALILWTAAAGETEAVLPTPVLQVLLAAGLVTLVVGLLGAAVAAIRAPRRPKPTYVRSLRSQSW